MKQKAVTAICGIILGAGLLTGCASTPESAVVKQKGTGSLGNYAEAEPLKAEEASEEQETADIPEEQDGAGSAGSGEGTGQNVLRTALGAPERYQSEVSDATGGLQILTDAVVEIPDVDKVSSISVSQHTFDQSVMDLITETFCSDMVFYTQDSYYQMTKEDYLRKIETLKGYVADGNLDPYDWGTDEYGNAAYDIYAQIESAEAAYEEAPESKELEEVWPQYGLVADYGEDGTFTYTDSFYGVGITPDGTVYSYIMKSYESMPMEVSIKKIRNLDDRELMVMWVDYKGLKASVPDIPEEEEVEAAVGITLEEAQAAADEKVAALGLDGMELASWEYALCYRQGRKREDWEDTGYVLHYTRKLNGIPITYTTAIGGALEDMDSVMEPWCYETLDITVTKDGIDSVEFYNEYDIGEVKTENLSLLSFDEIIEIYEKMMVIQNADILNYENSRTYHIDRITFGYSRIYEPATSSTTGLLVPVWDFFGSVESQYEYDGEQYDSVNASQYQSLLTINAVDGSIIDRGLGY